MGLNKKSVDDINVKGQRVLLRCDFNVPLKGGQITDENRLVAALPTIKKLIADGGKVILCSHLGKVKTEEDKKTKTLVLRPDDEQPSLQKQEKTNLFRESHLFRGAKLTKQNHTKSCKIFHHLI